MSRNSSPSLSRILTLGATRRSSGAALSQQGAWPLPNLGLDRLGAMAGDAIREALAALNEAWQAIQDGDYALDDEAKAEASKLLDEATVRVEEAAKIVFGEVA